MLPMRIACVKYLNTAPLIEGLEKLSGCRLIPAAPSSIAGLVERGEADVGLASIVDGASGNLSLIPVGMIGCDGPTLTVRLFSRVPMDRIKAVAGDSESHTSVVLCRLLLRRVYGIDARIQEWEAGQRPLPEAVLLIGDKVVTDAPPTDEYPHQLDLGECWKQLTGSPFVYAMWMCRADRADDESILLAAQLLDRQKRHNRTRLDWIAGAAAVEHGWPRALAADYLGLHLTYEVGEKERGAVERFLGMAHEDGLLESGPHLRWMDVPGPR